MPSPYLPPWLSVNSGDFLNAARAGADVGLGISRQRQASQEAAANRAAQTQQMQAQIQSRERLSLASLEQDAMLAKRRDEVQRLGLDLDQQRLTLSQTEQAFRERQGAAKAEFEAHGLEQRAGYLRMVANGEDPVKALAKYPMALPPEQATSLTMQRERLSQEKQPTLRQGADGREYMIEGGKAVPVEGMPAKVSEPKQSYDQKEAQRQLQELEKENPWLVNRSVPDKLLRISDEEMARIQNLYQRLQRMARPAEGEGLPERSTLRGTNSGGLKILSIKPKS